MKYWIWNQLEIMEMIWIVKWHAMPRPRKVMATEIRMSGVAVKIRKDEPGALRVLQHCRHVIRLNAFMHWLISPLCSLLSINTPTLKISSSTRNVSSCFTFKHSKLFQCFQLEVNQFLALPHWTFPPPQCVMPSILSCQQHSKFKSFKLKLVQLRTKVQIHFV